MISELQEKDLHFLGDGIKEILNGPKTDKETKDMMYT